MDLVLLNNDIRGLESRGLDKSEVGVTTDRLEWGGGLPYESPEEPDERFLELIVALSRDIIVLKILLSVESDLLGLNFSVLNINFVTHKDDGDVLAHSD